MGNVGKTTQPRNEDLKGVKFVSIIIVLVPVCVEVRVGGNFINVSVVYR